MRGREKVIFDIKSERFRYLQRDENKIKNVVNIDVLNKRLNEIKKTNLYTNIKMVTFSIITITLFVLISVNF